MSLGNSSSSSSQQVYDTTTKNLNIQGVEGLSIAGNEDATINVTDGGAVAKMADVSIRAIEENVKAGANVLDFARYANSDALRLAERASNNALKFAYDAGRQDASNKKTQLYIIGGLAVFAIAAAVLVKTK